MARRVSSPVFVGRSEQLQVLEAACGRAGACNAGAVFVGGESGVGKTRLMAEFERVALAAGARFLVGGCVDVGGSELPYAPLLGALRTLVQDTEPHVLEEMAGPGRGELGRLVPELAVPETGIGMADPLAQSRLFEGLLSLFARAGREEPVVLVIEDLHWADPSTRGFLSFLVRNMRRERLLLVATYRSDELHRRHPLRQFLAEVERLPTVERLELAPFARREMVEQLSAILGGAPDADLVDELFARSQGNPFFAEELLAAWGASGAQGIPESLRDALTLRVQRLSAEARRMVSCAAVAGTVAGHRLLATTAGLTEQEFADALREAIENNVLVTEPTGQSYALRHALLREALYDELVPNERVTLHAALARALERDPALAVGERSAAAQRAMHWSAAHELAPALAASVQAGEEAERLWAFAEANGHFEQAIELWQRVVVEQRPAGLTLVDLFSRAAEAAHLSGENQRAIALTRSALEMISPDEDPTAAGAAHERLGRYLLAQPALQQALEEFRAAAALIGEGPTAARASILAGEAHILMLQNQALAARAACEEAVRIARAVGSAAVECDALNSLGPILALLGAREDAIAPLQRAMRLAGELGALEQLRRAYINLAEVLDLSARLEEAAELTREGWQRLRQQIGSGALFIAAEAGSRLTRLGRWEDAQAMLGEAVEGARPNAPSGLALAALAEVEALQGDLSRAGTHLQSATRLLPTTTVLAYRRCGPVRAAAMLALARADPEELRQIVNVEAPLSNIYAAFLLPLLTLALQAEAELAHHARMDRDEAAEREAISRAKALLNRARALTAPDAYPLGSPPAEMLLEAELCELETRRAAAEASAVAWSALADRWEELGRPFQAAYAWLREAEATLAEDLPRDRVATALGSAYAIASRLGARPLLDEIELLSRRARIRVAEHEAEEAPSEVAGLTARELEVLHLMAEGRTNREIGGTLYISPKTASVHVSRILAKLDVKTRAQAVRVASRLGLLDTPKRQ